MSIAEYARLFDLVAPALARGLGCPGGTLLAGSRQMIAVVIRHRRRRTGHYAIIHPKSRDSGD